jgi:hypothetical protein
MTNRFTTLAAAAALFIDLSAPVWAGDDVVSIGSVGPWQLRTFKDACIAVAPFKNGTSLEFWLSAKGWTATSINNSDWAIPKGDYEVVMQVDRAAPEVFKGHAEKDWVIWHYDMTEATANLLSYGNTLSVTVGRSRYQYSLDRSEAMLKALGQCVSTRLASANPFSNAAPNASAPPSTPFPETTSNPYRRM